MAGIFCDTYQQKSALRTAHASLPLLPTRCVMQRVKEQLYVTMSIVE